MAVSQETSVPFVALAIGPCMNPTRPYSHAQPAISPARTATIAAQLMSPYRAFSGSSYRPATSIVPCRTTKKSTSITPPQAAIQTTTEAIQLSKLCAKLFDWMNTISTIVPIIVTTTETFQRAAFTSSDSAANVAEY